MLTTSQSHPLRKVRDNCLTTSAIRCRPSANEIVFPGGILQKPFFSKSWPEYLNFGSFGAIAGHELSHSLDQAGRRYDKDGKLTDWWTKSVYLYLSLLSPQH